MVANPSSLKNLDALLHHRLALLVAPQGSGKSRVVQKWVNHHASDNCLHFAWVTLKAKDNYPANFIESLLNGLDGIVPILGGEELVNNLERFDLEEILITLINTIKTQKDEVILILNDYHRINNDCLHKAVQYMLDYLPEHIHILIVSAKVPPLQIPRLRVRRQLVEIGHEDLG